jgi:hypothetical protein
MRRGSRGSCHFCNHSQEKDMPAKFRLGRVAITPGAKEELDGASVFDALLRHHQGDWGDVDPEDRKENERSLKEGFRLLSSYKDTHGTKFWIITEADRSATTILLPSEY